MAEEKKEKKEKKPRRLKRPLEQAITNGFIKNVSTYADRVVNGVAKKEAKRTMKTQKAERKGKGRAPRGHEMKVLVTRISKDSFTPVRAFANRLIRNILYSSTASV